MDDSTPTLDHHGGSTPELMVMEGTAETRPEDGATVICSFEIIAELGKGNFGTVSLTVDAEGQTYAIKTLHHGTTVQRRNVEGAALSRRPSAFPLLSTEVNGTLDPTRISGDAVQREIAVMKRLNHPNVVKLHAVIEDQQEGQTHLVMQYVENGPVATLKPDGTCTPLPLGFALHYMGQVARGLSYLHHCGIIHRDIKPENILIGRTTTPSYRILVCRAS
jgi:serine/threonine protein kinase